jgi:hypothetical protein
VASSSPIALRGVERREATWTRAEDLTAQECADEGGTIQGSSCLTDDSDEFGAGSLDIPTIDPPDFQLPDLGLVEVGWCGELTRDEVAIHRRCRPADDLIVIKAPLIGPHETARTVARQECLATSAGWTKRLLQVVCWAER